MAFHEVAMKVREKNRGELTSWHTMRWPLRRERRIEENSLHGLP